MPSVDITSPEGQKITIHAPDGATAEDIKRKAAQLFDKPNLAGESVPGVTGTGGPNEVVDARGFKDAAMSAGKTLLREAPGAALSMVLPETIPLAGWGSVAARTGLSMLGQGVGDIAGIGATEGRLPTNNEEAWRMGAAGGTGLMVDTAGKLLFTPAKDFELANKIKSAGRLTEDAAGQDATLAGIMLTDVNPAANRRIKRETTRLYGLVRERGKGIAPTSVPNEIIDSARDGLDNLGLSTETLVPAQENRVRQILQRIVDRGTPTVTEVPRSLDAAGKQLANTPLSRTVAQPEPIAFEDLLKWKRELNEVLPAYADRANPDTYTRGILSNIAQRIDGQIESMARGTPAAKALEDANTFFKNEVVPWRAAFEEISRNQASPTNLITGLTTAGRHDMLTTIYKRSDQQTRDVFSSAWFADAFDKAKDANGLFDTHTLLDQWKALGKSQKVIAQGKQGEITDLFNQIERVHSANKLRANIGRVASGMGAVAGVGNAIYAFSKGDAVGGTESLIGTVAASAVLPAILTSKGVVNAWNRGLLAPPRSNLAIRSGRVVAQALRVALGHYTTLTDPQQQEGAAAP